jgi:hypothetical protein
VCTTFTGSATDEAVQLQVIKVLLSAITSTACEVHEMSLLKVVQTCFNIHLHSRNQINQVTAKASLTQMINLIFSRMERYSEVLSKNSELLADAKGVVDGGVKEASIDPVEGESTESGSLSSAAANNASSADAPKQGGDDAGGSVQSTTVDEASASPEEMRPRVVGMLDEIEPSGVQTPASALEVSADQSSDQPTTLAIETEPKKAVVEGPNPYDPTISYYNSLLRKDAFLVFRLLCRLSMQTDGGVSAVNPTFTVASVTAAANLPADDLSPHTVRARSLALELILSVLNNAGPVLQGHELYAELVRKHLAASVSRNAITTNPALFELSLSIFLMVMRYYRARLKAEIEILLNTVYLHILEMGNSTFTQKSMVLQALLKICENPQILADLYLNYDCDLEMVSLFERIVSVCARVAQGKVSQVQQPPMTLMGLAVSAAGLDNKAEVMKLQDKSLRLRGAMCLLAIIQSLVEWSAELAPGIGADAKSPKSNPESLVSGGKSGDAESSSSSEDTVDSPNIGNTTPPQSSSADSQANGRSAVENATRSFLDALAPTAQANPVLVTRNPLHNISFQKGQLYSMANASNASLESARTIGGAGEDDPSQIEEIASRKLLLRQGIQLFAQKPTKGMAFFVKNGFVKEDAVAVAKFLASNPGLNKSAIGDYLGEGEAFPLKVMHSFVDLMEFGNLDFVAALRSFLQTFRLPGESQKVR